MTENRKLRIPHKLPAYLYDRKADAYRDSGTATVKQWRQAKLTAKADVEFGAVEFDYVRVVGWMVKLADTLKIPDDVPLVPRLHALAQPNVTSIGAD